MTLSKLQSPTRTDALHAGPVARETGGKGQHLPRAVQAQQPFDAGAGRIAAVGQRGHHPDCGDHIPIVVISSQPSQTLVPAPPSPTRFIPLFQSPVPRSVMPLAPVSATA